MSFILLCDVCRPRVSPDPTVAVNDMRVSVERARELPTLHGRAPRPARDYLVQECPHKVLAVTGYDDA